MTPDMNRHSARSSGTPLASPCRVAAMSPASADALARSMRTMPSTSPRLADLAPRSLFFSVDSSPPLHSAVDKRMRAVWDLCQHVREEGRRRGQEAYLPPPAPRSGRQSSEYWQLAYVRRRHRLGSMTLEEYAELAHQPHILGPEIFGEVVASGWGWRWSFKAAGLAVDSPVEFQAQGKCSTVVGCYTEEALPRLALRSSAWAVSQARHVRGCAT